MDWRAWALDQWQRALDREADAARRFQALGLQGAARAATAMLGEQPARTLGELEAWQVEVLRAVQARMCSSDGEDLPSPQAVGALEATLGYVRWMPPEARQQIGDLLALVEAAPLVMGPARRRFTALTEAQQDEQLRAWEGSPLPARRAVFRGLKAVCVMGFWTQPKTWGALGYSVARNPGVPEGRRAAWEAQER
jgi:hypothetical protein